MLLCLVGNHMLVFDFWVELIGRVHNWACVVKLCISVEVGQNAAKFENGANLLLSSV